METKSLAVEMKDADKGIVSARFATLGAKDHDGDITLPGAFGKQKVRVSAFGHTSWMGSLPVGVGNIHEEAGAAIADLQFNLNTTTGRDHFETVKQLGDLGEWSYGFDIMEEAKPDEEQRQAGVFRVLKRLKVHEVSPVLLGAGVDTRTLAVKDRGEENSANSIALRCANCSHWVGEAVEEMVRIGHEPNAKNLHVRPPRDLRLCRSCGRVTVFIPKNDLDRIRGRSVA
jgi:HK97 family phage prohead protease